MNDRERLIELIKQGQNATDCAYAIDCDVTAEECYACELNTVVDYLIANGVTIQKHGRWVKRYLDGEDMSGKPCEIMYACNCSECGLNGEAPTDYCPNCGAKMREEDK